MDRRRILLIVAVVVALLGTALVFLYVRGADARAEARFDTTQVLTAVTKIEAGESIDDAAASGKLTLAPVVQDDLLPNAQTSTEAIAGKVATVPIFPGEQIVSSKFGESAEGSSVLSPTIPKGMLAVSVNLTDPARVAGFVNPGTSVAIFLNGTDASSGRPFTRLLLPEVTVIGVGSTTTTQTTTTTPEGEQTTEQLPSTLLTIAVTQRDAEKILYGQKNGELVFGLLTGNSAIKAGPATTATSLFDR